MKKNSQSISSGDDSLNLLAGRDINFFYGENFPTELVDQRIGDEVEKIRKARFFAEFDRIRSSLTLGSRIVKGNLSRGSDAIRSLSLAWCARILSRSDKVDKAEEFLEIAKTLGNLPETKIAEAYIISQKGDKAASLKALGGLYSPASRSAALMVVAHHDSAEGAIKWMIDAGLKVKDLDSDGKSFLLIHQLELSHWEAGEQVIAELNGTDFEEMPILYYLVALIKLLSTVPADFRTAVFKQVPFEIASFPIASDAVAMDARRTAHGLFLDAVKVAQRLECPNAARLNDEYALWLELKDPAQADHARNRLEEKLRDPKSALGIVHFALQFGVKLNLDAVERDIEQQIAINGGMTIDAAKARYAIAFTQKTPEDAANYIARYQNQLSTYFDTSLIQFLQIELLSRAGLTTKANECLDKLVRQGITEEEETRLRNIIAEAEGKDTTDARKTQYKTTKALGDLINLVDELETRQHWDEVCEYGSVLFENTHSLRDAERLVNAFNNSNHSRQLVEFLKTNPDFLSQSKNLQMSYAWGLYNEGSFIEARNALAELKSCSESPNCRALQVNLGIAMGDWASLSAFVANERQCRDNRSAQDLLSAAQLALYLGSPHARDLVSAAAASAGDDAAILASAYFLASKAGWEDDPKVFKWLERAALLSDDNGPIKQMSLKDILQQKPEWERRESETWKMLGRGEMPIFLAAQSLNRTLIDLTVFPALANLTENDPRRRSAIPAYSGKRIPEQFNITGTTVTIDATALLTLSFLKVLDETLDAFQAVYIPHSTLGWLFEEQQKAAFHQPSQIQKAHQVRHLLATDVLERFVPTTVANSDLSAQVGDELSALIAEAEKVREDENTQRIVVRSSPVYRLSSLLEEEADLSSHASVLSSCLAVLSKLRHKGQITAEEENRARAYLQLHEKPWPNQPEISDGAILYLDDLTITYLLHLGILGKLKAAGLRAVVSPRKASEGNNLISYEGISEDVKDIIERIRAALNSRIESGQVRVGRRQNLNDDGGESIPEHPTVGIIALSTYCDAAIVDDRFINQHTRINDGSKQMQIFTTLDILDALVTDSVISEGQLREYRTRLRRSGYFFVPVNEKELERYLKASAIVSGKVVETAELKAIRQFLLHVRMSDWLQLPKEAKWLDATLKAYIRVLKRLWLDSSDLAECMARSDWIADQVDLRGWAHCFGTEQGDNIVRIGRGAHTLLLLSPPLEANQDIVNAYWKWVEERFLSPIKEQFPDIYIWLSDWFRSQVADMSETESH